MLPFKRGDLVFQAVYLPVERLEIVLTFGALFTTALFFAKPVLVLKVAIEFGTPASTLQFLKGAKPYCTVHSHNVLYVAETRITSSVVHMDVQ